MRIFYSFLIIVCSTILILLPVTGGIYNFRTDVRANDFYVETETTENTTVQLTDSIYDDDTSTIDLSSSLITDSPYWSYYNTSNRALAVQGLTSNETRTLSVSYDINAVGDGAISTFLDYLPWIWILIWVAFPIAGLAAIWLGKA